MERDLTHTVAVVKSQRGVRVYSMVSRGEEDEERKLLEYESFVDAEDKTTRELQTQERFYKLYGKISGAEKLAFVFLILKDVITNSTNTSGGMDKDILPIIGIMGLYVITNLASDMNINNSILSRHKLKAVKEAQKKGYPQYEQIFPLHREEN